MARGRGGTRKTMEVDNGDKEVKGQDRIMWTRRSMRQRDEGCKGETRLANTARVTRGQRPNTKKNIKEIATRIPTEQCTTENKKQQK